MKKALAAAAVFAVLGVAAPQANASTFYIGWHWKRSANPFTVMVRDSLTSKYTDALAGAVSDWSKSDKLDMTVVPGDTSRTTRKQCVAGDHEVHICNFNYGATGWAGLTQVTSNGHHIVRVKVRLNDYYVTRGFTRTVACHELGHTLGLAHRHSTSSCMTQGQTRAHPDSHDYAHLDSIYTHLDGMTPDTTSGTSEQTASFYDWVGSQ